jgi:hypothetical protein
LKLNKNVLEKKIDWTRLFFEFPDLTQTIFQYSMNLAISLGYFIFHQAIFDRKMDFCFHRVLIGQNQNQKYLFGMFY